MIGNCTDGRGHMIVIEGSTVRCLKCGARDWVQEKPASAVVAWVIIPALAALITLAFAGCAYTAAPQREPAGLIQLAMRMFDGGEDDQIGTSHTQADDEKTSSQGEEISQAPAVEDSESRIQPVSPDLAPAPAPVQAGSAEKERHDAPIPERTRRGMGTPGDERLPNAVLRLRPRSRIHLPRDPVGSRAQSDVQSLTGQPSDGQREAAPTPLPSATFEPTAEPEETPVIVAPVTEPPAKPTPTTTQQRPGEQLVKAEDLGGGTYMPITAMVLSVLAVLLALYALKKADDAMVMARAKAERGEVGKHGVQGIQGLEGPAGESIRGPEGPAGPPGPPGESIRGPEGPAGKSVRGPQGEEGEEGVGGVTGDRGLRGHKGTAGDEGARGLRGFTGKVVEVLRGGKKPKGR